MNLIDFVKTISVIKVQSLHSQFFLSNVMSIVAG